MKTLLALLLLTTPAFAGTTITVSVGSVQEIWNLSDADQQKFEAWVKVAYKCAPATTTPPPTTACDPMTLAESETEWALATLRGTANNVDRFQDIVAAKIATEATAPIGFSVKGKTK